MAIRSFLVRVGLKPVVGAAGRDHGGVSAAGHQDGGAADGARPGRPHLRPYPPAQHQPAAGAVPGQAAAAHAGERRTSSNNKVRQIKHEGITLTHLSM